MPSRLVCSVNKRLPVPGRMYLLDGNSLAAYNPAAAKLEPVLSFSPQVCCLAFRIQDLSALGV